MSRLIMIGCLWAAGCAGVPPEAARVQSLGDQEITALRLLAEDAIDAEAAAHQARVWDAWEAEWPGAKDPQAKVSADFAAAMLEAREDKLAEIEAVKASKRRKAAGYHANAVKASGAIIEAWHRQGQLTAESFQTLRDGALKLAEEYATARKARKDARQAAREARAAEHAAEGAHE